MSAVTSPLLALTMEKSYMPLCLCGQTLTDLRSEVRENGGLVGRASVGTTERTGHRTGSFSSFTGLPGDRAGPAAGLVSCGGCGFSRHWDLVSCGAVAFPGTGVSCRAVADVAFLCTVFGVAPVPRRLPHGDVDFYLRRASVLGGGCNSRRRAPSPYGV